MTFVQGRFLQKIGFQARSLLASSLLADAEIFNLDFFSQVGVVAIAAGSPEIAPVDRSISRRVIAQWSTVGFIGGV